MCDPDGPLAMWRDMGGKKQFMGIVIKHETDDGNEAVPPEARMRDPRYPGRAYFKLDDPRDDLDGPGHFMATMEVMAEMACYDDTTLDRAKPLENAVSVACKDRRIIAGLKPTDPIVEDNYDEYFPFELNEKYGVIARVRSGDQVGIALRHGGDDSPIDGVPRSAERFDLGVIAVTSNGIITATPHHSAAAAPDVGEDDLVCFSADCVLAVKHDAHWPDLRFKIGDRVYALVDDGWQPGKILKVKDHGKPYRIELEDAEKTNVWAPVDDDEVIKQRE